MFDNLLCLSSSFLKGFVAIILFWFLMYFKAINFCILLFILCKATLSIEICFYIFYFYLKKSFKFRTSRAPWKEDDDVALPMIHFELITQCQQAVVRHSCSCSDWKRQVKMWIDGVNVQTLVYASVHSELLCPSVIIWTCCASVKYILAADLRCVE